jgi:glycosyltransferase involved in cell wall biosynthesis
MAHILKHPTADTKGILILSHKEIRYIYSDNPYFNPTFGRLDKYKKKLISITKNKSGLKFQSTLKKINSQYLIGVHFGWEQLDYPTIPNIDFYMGGPTTVTFKNREEVHYIPLDGSSFIPTFFYCEEGKNHPKIWDIIMVARDVRWKNLDLFLKSIRKLYDQGKHYKTLLLIPSNNDFATDNDSSKTYVELMDDYQQMFSYKERGWFTILKTHTRMPFYHLSKVFALFSRSEGGSRVISEALLGGLPVVVYDGLTGGGKDFLNDENSVQFNDFENAHIALDKAVINWKELNNNNNAVLKNTEEQHSIVVLKTYLKEVYKKQNLEFDGKLDDTEWLSFKLNSHWHEGLSWANKRFIDPDIRTEEQFNLLLKELKL